MANPPLPPFGPAVSEVALAAISAFAARGVIRVVPGVLDVGAALGGQLAAAVGLTPGPARAADTPIALTPLAAQAGDGLILVEPGYRSP